MSNVEELKSVFASRNITFGPQNEKVLKEYARICGKYGRDAQNFVDEVEAKITVHPDSGDSGLVMKKTFISALERDFKRIRKKELMMKQKKKKKKSAKRRPSLPSSRKERKKPFPSRKEPTVTIKPEPKSTPKKSRPEVRDFPLPEANTKDRKPTPIFQPTPVHERKKLASREEVVLTYGCKPTDKFFNANDGYPTLELLTGISTSEKYMTDTMAQKSDLLSDQICLLVEEALETVPENERVVHPLDALPNTEGLFWGRILCEDKEGFSKLNRNSIILEGFKDSSNNYVGYSDTNETTRIAKLDLSEFASPAVFYPGQAVVVKGRLMPHPLGTLKVKGIVSTEMRYTPTTEEKRENNEESVHILVAHGPFTTLDNVEFYPLMTILEVAQQKEVDLLMLIGPFLPKYNHLVRDDRLMESYEDIMRKKVMGLIQHQPGLKNKTSVLLIPSIEDIHNDFVYPQPPYYSQSEIQELQLFHTSKFKREMEDEEEEEDDELEMMSKKKSFLHCFSNPCVFGVKNIRIGVGSVDVFNQVRRNAYPTVVFPNQNTEYYHVLKEILRQNLFFPTHFMDPKVPFDCELAEKFCLRSKEEEKKRGGGEGGKLRPDIVILPSKSDVFVMEVGKSLVVNPGRLVKNIDDEGTYAHIIVEKDFLKKTMEDEENQKNPIKVQCVSI